MKLIALLMLFVTIFCFSNISSAAAQSAQKSGNTPTAHAYRSKAPQLKEMGGQEVDTKYFKVIIPAGWSMPVPVQSTPHNGVTALFVSMSQSPAVSITVMETPATAKQLGEMTLENMKKGGIASTPLEEKDGMWHSNLSGKGKGSIWFGDNNGITSVTVITGDDIEKAEDFFSVLSPKTERLFPKKAQ